MSSPSEHKSDVEKLRVAGNECFKKGEYKQAISHYTIAIAESSNNEKLYSNRCACYQQLHDFESALRDIDTAIAINPKWWKPHCRKAKMLRALNRDGSALLSYKSALEYMTVDDAESQRFKHQIEKRVKEIGNQHEVVDRLSDKEVLQFMSSTYLKRKDDSCMNAPGRKDFTTRVEFLRRFVREGKYQTFECKDLFGLESTSPLLQMMAVGKAQMGCHGDSIVDFTKFNQHLSCHEAEKQHQIGIRFDEWVQAGMCHRCQSVMFEQNE